MQIKNFISKATAAVLSAALVTLFGAAEYYSSNLPDHITTDSDNISFAAYPDLDTSYISDNLTAVSFMDVIPVKKVSVDRQEPPVLAAGGSPFGIKLLMEGVMVTDMSDIDSSDGKICPARSAGLQLGDVITLANGIPVSSNSDLQRIISESCGNSVDLSVNRDGGNFNTEIVPAYSKKDKKWKGGMWVRDSIAGIGTLTFVDTATGQFAGLGHPVCDTDTGELIPLHSGEAVPVKITEAKKGKPGSPGELHGQFIDRPIYGSLSLNSEKGIFGTLSPEAAKILCDEKNEYKMGYRQDVTTGEAFILTTISGSEPEMYSAEIEQINYNSRESSKNMIIRITDEKLIESSGGIVQGMSGSPIIQNDRIIGAVTHVFVADPTRGYAIFAENMYETMK